jgi:hypothetical protein
MDLYGKCCICYTYSMWSLPRFPTYSRPSCFMFHENYVHCKTVIRSLCISLQDEFIAMKIQICENTEVVCNQK